MVFDAADGYALLFGGLAGEYNVGTTVHTECLNDTWSYSDGIWTNLSIPGPPPTCQDAMAYDAADGYIVAYLVRGDIGYPGYINETWTYAHGVWSRLDSSDPNVTFGLGMSYDPHLGAVLLFGGARNVSGAVVPYTWEFASGNWTQLPVATSPGANGHSGTDLMTWDALDGYPLMMSTTRAYGQGGELWDNGSWAFVNSTWTLKADFPFGPLASLGGLAFDGQCECTIMYGGINGFGLVNYTWAYSAGSWWNLSAAHAPAPPERAYTSMAFDSGAGAIVVFGGIGSGPINVLTLLSDTWVYAPAPTGMALKVTSSPRVICAVLAPDCGATEAATVTVSLRAAPVSGSGSWGVDAGNGTIEYGPLPGAYSPSLTFLGIGSLAFASNLTPVVSCGRGDGGSVRCGAEPVYGVLPSGAPTLTWGWQAAGPGDSMELGDWWIISFRMTAVGPPYGTVPLLSCVTVACHSGGSQAIDGSFSSLVFANWSGAGRTLDSLPYSSVTVLSVAHSEPAPTPQYPSPPSQAGSLPAPVPVPISSGATPQPIGTQQPLLTGPSPLYAIAAGMVAAGFTRGVLTRPPLRVRLAVRASISSTGGRRRRVQDRGPWPAGADRHSQRGT